MEIAYFVVAGIILIAGFIIMLVTMSEEMIEPGDGAIFWRTLAVFTFGTWFAAALWPALLVLVVPVLIVYGAIVAVKGIKNKTLDY